MYALISFHPYCVLYFAVTALYYLLLLKQLHEV